MTSALLLAETEAATSGFLERHLRQDGFDVVQAGHGEAVELAERSRPDLVLSCGDLPWEDLERIVDLQLARVEALLAERKLRIAVTPAARRFLATEGYDPVFGARPLKRAMPGKSGV